MLGDAIRHRIVPMDSREFLRQWFDTHDLTMREASIGIGRNHAYIQQYIDRGVPRQLGEDDRKALARLLDVPEAKMKDPPGTRPSPPPKPEPKPATVDFSRKTPTPQGPRDLPVYFEIGEVSRTLSVDNQRLVLQFAQMLAQQEARPSG